MNFWRAIIASLLSLVCTLAVSTYVTLETLNSTVLNRNEVKTWLDKSGIYNHLLGTVLSSNQTAQDQLNTGSSIVSSDNLKTGLNQTFSASYVKQAAEKAIDSTYDWLDGSAPTISFSVDTTAKKDDFIANLSSILEPQLAALPRCTSIAQFDASNPTCLPPGTSAKQAAGNLATDAANQASIFNQPVSSQTVAQATDGSNQNNSPLTSSNSNSNQVRSVISNLRQWLLWLPIMAVASGGLMVLLSQHRLKAGKHLAGRLTWGLGLTCLAGLLVANVGRTFSLSNYTSGTNSPAMTQIVEPVIHQAAPAIGNRLALISGLLGAATLAIWITLLVIQRQRKQAELITPSNQALTTPNQSAPATTTPSQNATPTAPQSQPAPANLPKDGQR